MTKVDFACDAADFGALPAVLGGVAFFEIKLRCIGFLQSACAVCEPFEVAARVFDHFFTEVGAIGGIAHKHRFLQDNAGTAEWVKHDRFGLVLFFEFASGNIN